MSQSIRESTVGTTLPADMGIDGRTLTRETLEALRFMALGRMAEGESLAAASVSFGVHRTCAYKAWPKARGRGKGKRSCGGAWATPDVERRARGARVSVGQRQEPTAVWLRLRAVDAPARGRVDHPALRCGAEPGFGGGTARASRWRPTPPVPVHRIRGGTLETPRRRLLQALLQHVHHARYGGSLATRGDDAAAGARGRDRQRHRAVHGFLVAAVEQAMQEAAL